MLRPTKKGNHYQYSIWSHPVARVLKLRNVQQYLELVPQGGKVLDYGSGDRPYQPMLLEKFAGYVAGDHPEANLKHGSRPDVFIVDEHIDLESDSLDCVFLTEVLEHVFRPATALSEIHRVLKSDGFVIASVPFAMGEHEAPYDFHRYTSFAIKRLADEAGFEVVELDYVGDMCGVAVSLITRLGKFICRGLAKIKLKPIAWLLELFFRIPEVLYYLLTRTPFSPSRISYFRTYPLGFTFCLKKIEADERLSSSSESSKEAS